MRGTPPGPKSRRALRSAASAATSSALAARIQPALPRQHTERIVIDLVDPCPKERRAPLRRLVGDSVQVSADLACDGDAVLAACICYRVPGEPRWRFAPMQPAGPAHRWRGAVRLQSGGRYRVSVEAWVDAFATLRERTLRALERGDDARAAREALAAVLLESAGRAAGADRELLESRATAVREAGDAAALRASCDRQLHKRMWVHGARHDLVRATPAFDVVVDRRRAGFAAWWIGAPPATHADAERRGPAATAALEDVARLGIDVLCLPTPAHLAAVGDAGPRGEAARLQEQPRAAWARRVTQARRLGLEIALDWTLAEHTSGTAPALWNGAREQAWNAALEQLRSIVQAGVHVVRVRGAENQPLPFWSWIVERIKRQHPELVLAVEGRPSAIQEDALARTGLSMLWPRERWAESPQLGESLHVLADARRAQLLRPHLIVDLDVSDAATDDDVARLQQQLLLATMLSPTCAFRAAQPLRPFVSSTLRSLLRIRRENRALQLASNVRIRTSDNERILFVTRALPELRNDVLVVVNLDARTQEGRIDVPLAELGLDEAEPYEVEDLLTGARQTWRGCRRSVRLDPQTQPGMVLRIVRPSRLGELL